MAKGVETPKEGEAENLRMAGADPSAAIRWRIRGSPRRIGEGSGRVGARIPSREPVNCTWFEITQLTLLFVDHSGGIC